MLRAIETASIWGGGIGVFLSSIVPDDFREWKVTAICGFIACLAMVLKHLGDNKNIESIKEQSKSIDKLADKFQVISIEMTKANEMANERIRRSDETNQKLGEVVTQMATTNQKLSGMNDNLEKRPCIIAHNT